MKLLKLTLALVIAAALLTPPATYAQAPPQPPSIPPQSGQPSYVPGEALVRLKSTISMADSVNFSRLGATYLGDVGGAVLRRVAIKEPVESAVARMRLDPTVEYAQPNYVRYAYVAPNDPRYANGNQGDPQNADSNDFQKWLLNGLLNAESAWDLTTGRSDVVIAMIDSGVKLDLPDLAGNIWANSGETPGNGTDDDHNGYVDDVNGWDFSRNTANPGPEPGDGNGDPNVSHGTFTATVADSIGNNGADLAGAAWHLKLMPLKVFRNTGGATDSNIIAAIDYAANNGANVINLSLGSVSPDPCPVSAPAVEAAITRAHNRGVVVVAAAGNETTNSPSTPASCSHVISVGASGHNSTYLANLYSAQVGSKNPDGRASFSNYGPYVDVAAPGVGVLAQGVRSVTDQNLGRGQAGTAYTAFVSGTSFSAPIVSALAGLLISRAKDLGQTLAPNDVKNIIDSTAVALPADPTYGANWAGHGRVNFGAAVAFLGMRVNSSLILQGGSRPQPVGWQQPVTVKLFTPGADVTSATPLAVTQATGTFDSLGMRARLALNIPASGTFDVTASAPGTLTNVKTNQVLANNSTLDMGTLLSGDANGDGAIGINDFGVLSSTFLKKQGDAGFDSRADFDSNGIVNIFDFGLLAVNFGKTSPIQVP